MNYKKNYSIPRHKNLRFVMFFQVSDRKPPFFFWVLLWVLLIKNFTRKIKNHSYFMISAAEFAALHRTFKETRKTLYSNTLKQPSIIFPVYYVFAVEP